MRCLLSGWQIKRVKKSGEVLPDLDITPHVSYGGLLSDGDVLYVADLNCATIGIVPKDGGAATFVTNP